MPSQRKHVKHVNTEMKQYVRLASKVVPLGSDYGFSNPIPQPQDLVNIASPHKFLMGISNDYYELTGKQPTDLEFGEIAVAYSKGCERLFIKNSNSEIVEFRPYQQPDTTSAVIRTMDFEYPKDQYGPEKIYSVNGFCKIEIPYENIMTDVGVEPNRPMIVAVRHNNIQRSDVDVEFGLNENDEEVVTLKIPCDSYLDPTEDFLTLVFVGSPFLL